MSGPVGISPRIRAGRAPNPGRRFFCRRSRGRLARTRGRGFVRIGSTMAEAGNGRDATGEAPWPAPEVDHFLRFLVTVMDNTDFEVGVTLNVGGVLVSGLLVGYDKYVEGVVSQLRGAGGDKDTNGFVEEIFRRYAEVYNSEEQGDDPAPEPAMDTIYIHLGEAR